LEEACKEEKDQYVQDSVIQRFEFTFELLWKTLRYYLLIQWIEKNSPREVIIESFKQWLIKDLDLFINMKNTRNLTSHTYDEDLAEEVYNFICKYLNWIAEVINKLIEFNKDLENSF